MTSKGRRALFALVAMLGGLCAGALVLEIGLQVAGYNIPSHRHYAPGFYVADAELKWRLQPSYSGVYRGYEGDAPATTNASGFRGPEWTPERLSAANRVLCLGDSVTFGYGVKDEETYPRQLEGLLPSGSAVFNGGVPGFQTTQELALGAELIALVKPQVVVLVWLPNDVLEGQGEGDVEVIEGHLVTNRKRYEKRKKRWEGQGVHASALYRLLRTKVRAYSHSFEGWEANLDEAALAESRELIKAIEAKAKGAGARFLLVLQPRREELESQSDCSHYARMRAWAAEAKIPCLDLFQAWRADPPVNEDHFLPRDGVHLKGLGYRSLAVAVASHAVFGKLGANAGASREETRRAQ